MPVRLLKQLNKLSTLQPDLGWQEATRNFLVTRARVDTIAKQPTLSERFSVFAFIFYKKYLPSPLKIMAIVSALAMTVGANFAAQAEYRPKTPLYSVKRVFENVEFVFAVSPESEATVNLKHAKKRQAEAVKIAAGESDAADKAENLNTVIKKLEQNLLAAKSGLEIVKNQDGQQTVDLAKKVNENTAEAIETLNQVQASAPSTEVAKTVSEAQGIAEEANTASLKVLVDSAVKTPENGSVSKAEVKDLISQKLERTEEKIKQTAHEAGTDSAQAQKIVKEAKNLLNKDALTQALEKVEKVANIAQESANALNKVEVKNGLTGTSSDQVVPGNATGTSPACGGGGCRR